MARVWLALVVGLVVCACQGTIHGTPDEDVVIDEDGRTESGVCAQVGDQPLRRLSSVQFHNTVRDLFPGELGQTLAMMSFFPETVIDDGFENDAIANTVNSSESNTIEDNAEELANFLLDNAATYLPQTMSCVDAGYADSDVDACKDQFIDELGLRVNRRPLRPQERTIAIGLYDEIRALQDANGAWAAVMQFFLQSPALLYRTEAGAGVVDGAPDLVALTDWEMASRLSYFFSNSMPDDELFAAAAAGELSTAAEVETHARRLVATPRAMDAIADFHRDWLHLHSLEDVVKASSEWDENVRTAMLQETRQYLEHQLEGDATFASLMLSSEFPIDPALANVYGVADADGSPVALDERRGLLTLAAFATAHSKEAVTNPVERGAFIRTEVLCAGLPEFPGDVDTSGPLESTADLPTARQRLAPLMERSDCRGCHTQFNPLGFALEQFDEIGQFRTEEQGATIDTSGEISLADISGAFADGNELIDRIANSDAAEACYTTQWFRFAQGRTEVANDACAMDSLQTAVAESSGDLRELMVAITQSEAFRYHPALQAEQGEAP